MGVGDFLFDFFAGLGDQGILLALFLLFLLDAILVPTLPELFFILGIGANPSWEFSFAVLMAGFAGELAGLFSLYFLVRLVGLPRRIEKALNKYLDFLIVNDEKVMLINRAAPMIPFAGAFMAIMRKRWDVRKCVMWSALGYFIKYGLIMILGQSAAAFFDSGTSRYVMLVGIFIVIGLSMILTFYRKRQLDKKDVGSQKEP